MGQSTRHGKIGGGLRRASSGMDAAGANSRSTKPMRGKGTVTTRRRIAVVGAGHNALVCACYLAQAGHDVTVYERRSRVGGAVNTEEMWWEACDDHKGSGGNSKPDMTCEKCVSHKYLVDTCSVMHILIHKTPVIQELELHKFGLEYMQMEPWGFAPFPDGSYIIFKRDLD